MTNILQIRITELNSYLHSFFVELQEAAIMASVQSALNNSKFDGIFCVAGGWAGGNATKGKCHYCID